MDEVRSQVLQEVKEYFVGPRKEDEKIKDDPLETYISGVLHPQNAPEEEMDDGDSDAGRDDKENPDDSHGIETKIQHPELMPKQPAYKRFSSYTPKADKLVKKILCVPVHEKLTQKQLDYVVSHFRLFFNKKN